MFQFTGSSRLYKLLDAHFPLVLTSLKPVAFFFSVWVCLFVFCFFSLCVFNLILELHDSFIVGPPLLVVDEIVQHLTAALSQFDLWYCTAPKAFRGLQSIFQFARSSRVYAAFPSVQEGPWGSQLFPRGRSLGVLESCQSLPSAILPPAESPEPPPGSLVCSPSPCRSLSGGEVGGLAWGGGLFFPFPLCLAQSCNLWPGL